MSAAQDIGNFWVDKDQAISVTVKPCEGKVLALPAEGVTAKIGTEIIPSTAVLQDGNIVIAIVIAKDTQSLGRKIMTVYPNTDNGSDYFELNAIIEGIESNS